MSQPPFGQGQVVRHLQVQPEAGGRIVRPTIGFAHDAIEFLVQFIEDQHQPVIEGAAIGLCHVGWFCPGADQVADIVEPGQGQVRMLGQNVLAMRVEFLGNGGDFAPDRIGRIGEREGIEAAGFRVNRPIFKPVAAVVFRKPDFVLGFRYVDGDENPRTYDGGRVFRLVP